MSDIIIKINDKEYTIEEAQELYNELSKLFKTKKYLPYIPYPFIQEPARPISPYYTTCTDSKETE